MLERKKEDEKWGIKEKGSGENSRFQKDANIVYGLC